jgi:hypothetical protein
MRSAQNGETQASETYVILKNVMVVYEDDLTFNHAIRTATGLADGVEKGEIGYTTHGLRDVEQDVESQRFGRCHNRSDYGLQIVARSAKILYSEHHSKSP